MSKTPIEFKGSIFTLSVIHVHDVKPDAIRQAIEKKVAQAPEFLKDAPVVINVSNIEQNICWKEFSKTILSTGLHVVGISGCSDVKLKQAIINSGLPLLTEGKILKHNDTASSIIKETRCIHMPVRSGQQIYAQNSDLIVIGSVNAGAELIADGNIHIYGTMRGRALAGASGNTDSQIFCTSFFPELISIAGQYCLNDQIPTEYLYKSIRLCLQNGTITIHPLI
ncbi:septum site-determining protein MinC [Candidatus Curculioniphilus buchneri]|uniref:septum site-determining protein MinC n=1 Tax=Candidatus Curculioniphilus buchneri TaxID=690594 RepID=UPI00376F242C